MPRIYVLDVPEFRCLVDDARKRPGYNVTSAGRGYYRIESEDELVFRRKELGVKPAVWYGLFTGGLVGRITEFDRDVVRIQN
ncbi:MAG TPA: hypothetical protein VJT77_09035 [Burkholderiales bacterium]|nr:hypothetical protein [Burkholderiales bacterium]